MAIEQVSTYPFYGQHKAGEINDGADKNKKQNDELANELAQLERNANAAQDAFLKKIELVTLKAKNKAVIDNLRTQEEDAERAYRQFEKTKNSKGAGTVDSGKSGFVRWLSNAGTALVNMGKSIIGYDKNGNWDPVKCVTNIGITAAAIGATFIPYVGPVIGYGLLTTGVIGGAIGVANGIDKLNKAEKNGDQRKIDEAQQDICGNAFIGITSALGLRGIGKAFRTSSSTAEMASSATARNGIGGKCIESVSNFGRDITVNAFRSTKYSASQGLTPSLGGFKSWTEQYKVQYKKISESYTQKIAELESKILAETNPAKKVLLQEQKQLLEANLAEFNTIGRTVKSKANFDKLAKDNMAKFNEEYVQATYTKNTAGEYDINGILVKEQEFMNFQNSIIRQQRALGKELQKLIKTKENMMRTFAKHPEKHRAALDEYISTTDVKRSWYKPSDWLKTKELIAIGGKNPGYVLRTFNSALTHPASNVAKFSGAWVTPIHSGAMLLTSELTPEETQAQLETMRNAIDSISALREKMEKSQTVEEFNEAITEYNNLVAAANGKQPSQETEQETSQE